MIRILCLPRSMIWVVFAISVVAVRVWTVLLLAIEFNLPTDKI